VSLKLLHNSNLLQISISGSQVVEASLTISFLYQYHCWWWKSENIIQCFVCHPIYVFRFSLLHRRKCNFTYLLYVVPSIECIFSPKSFSSGNLSLLTNFQKLLVLYIFIKRYCACSN